LKSAGVAFTAFVPAISNAAVGESPRFSVFGLVGDGTSLSEGAAYGTDQSVPLYSPYSVYGTGEGAIYNENNPEFSKRAKNVLAETKKRLARIPGYVEKKKWYEVYNELDRYMYETRGAVKSLASTPAQKKAATEFIKAIEKTDISARRRNQEACMAAAKESEAKLDAFVASI
jgi:photosystem II oxygen-evolving enhancer protein 3